MASSTPVAANVANPTLTAFNNSVVVRQSEFKVGKYTDLNWLYNWYRKDYFTNYKGMISVWNQRKLMNTPLLKMTELQNNVISVNGPEGKFTYSMPQDITFPFMVENLVPDVPKPGIDGQKFKIKLSEQFSNTDRITYDLIDGVNLYVTEDEIYPEGDGWVHTVTVVSFDRKNAYFPQKYLQAGTQFMKISNSNGEYDTQKSSIMARGGSMLLEHQIGAGRSISHWITAYADMVQLPNDPVLSARYSNYLEQKNTNHTLLFYNTDAKGNPIPGSMKWMRRIEAMLWSEMKEMEERDLIWSQGGIVEGSGQRKVRVGQGLYQQMRNGNRFLIAKYTRDILEEAIGGLYYNSGIPIDKRRTVLQVGQGAFIEIARLFAAEFAKTPFLVNAKDIGLIYGNDRMNLGFGYRFTAITLPVAGNVTMEHNPAFDAITTRASDAPLIGEYPIHSYTAAVLDVTDGNQTNAAAKVESQVKYEDGFNPGSNIFLVKPQGYEGTYWGYKLGTHHPAGPGAMQGMFSATDRDGYEMWMKNQSSIFLKDATRTVLIERQRTQ